MSHRDVRSSRTPLPLIVPLCESHQLSWYTLPAPERSLPKCLALSDVMPTPGRPTFTQRRLPAMLHHEAGTVMSRSASRKSHLRQNPNNAPLSRRYGAPQLASTATAFSRASRCPARDALPDQGAGQRTPCWLVGGVVREGAVEYSARWSASDAATAAAAQRFVATTEYLSLWKRRDLANLG